MTGKELIEMGFKPAKWFGKAIEHINEYKLEDKERLDYIQSLLPLPFIEPFNTPVTYIKNISADNEDEELNILNVFVTMNELMKTPTIVGGCVMPDACPTGEPGQIPVGGVVIAKNAIHPSMHSADMCCSVFATNLGDVDPKDVLDIAMKTTQFGQGGRKGYNGWSSLLINNKSLYNRILENYFTKDYIEKALSHLGTQGDGNHFFYVGKSKATRDVWIVTHSGSRGFGSSVFKKGMEIADRYRRELSPNTLKVNSWIPADSIEGELYWDAIQIVRDWTKLNHSSIHSKVANALEIAPKDSFWNEHNSVFKDGDLYYHAKGATPLLDKFVPDSFDGRRLIPLNMAQPILVVKGEYSENNLGFAPHGAGRNMSRSQYNRNQDGKTAKAIFQEIEHLDIRFYSERPDISELPAAYKNAENVKAQMKEFGLGEIVDEILPYGCIMAGECEPIWKTKKKNK